MQDLIPSINIQKELGIDRDDIVYWIKGHLNIYPIKINRFNYFSKDDYLKIKEFFTQDNLEEVKKKLMLEKRKETCIRKYGGTSPMASKEIKEKLKNTMLEKYGVENPSQSKELRTKIKNTWIKNYGVDNPNKSQIIRNKSKQTCLKKYGVEYTTQSKNMIVKSKQTKLERYGDENYNNRDLSKKTCLKKYGFDNINQVESVKSKTVQTCLEKYGVEHYTQTKEMKDKSKETLLKHYGVEHPSQSKEIQEKVKETLLNKYGVEHPLQSSVFLRKSHKKWQVEGLSDVEFASKEEAYYYMYLKNHDVEFEYQIEYPKTYIDENGIEHKYMVDFKVGENFIEIKGNQFFDDKGNPIFIYKTYNEEYDEKRLNQWKLKLNMINKSKDIEMILSNEFGKNGKYNYMKKYFDENFKFIKNF